MRIVLDTNVLVQIISAKNQHHWIWKAILNKKFFLCATTDILNEYHEIITTIYKNAIFADAILDVIVNSDNFIKVEKFYFWDVPYADEDDQKFVDCYVAAGAQYLVTQDKVFFKELHKISFLNVKAIKPDKFLEIYMLSLGS